MRRCRCMYSSENLIVEPCLSDKLALQDRINYQVHIGSFVLLSNEKHYLHPSLPVNLCYIMFIVLCGQQRNPSKLYEGVTSRVELTEKNMHERMKDTIFSRI